MPCDAVEDQSGASADCADAVGDEEERQSSGEGSNDCGEVDTAEHAVKTSESEQIRFNGVAGVVASEEEDLGSYASYMDAVENWEASSSPFFGMPLSQARALIEAQGSEARAMSARRVMLRTLQQDHAQLMIEFVATWLANFPDPQELRGPFQDLHPILSKRRGEERRALQADTLREVRCWANLVRGSWLTSVGSWTQVPKEVVLTVLVFLVPREGSLAIPLLQPSVHMSSRMNLQYWFNMFGSKIYEWLERMSTNHTLEEELSVCGIIFHSWRLANVALEG
eukprot:TRINITY_DN8764_c1_g10_i1.p1 TRINITY_DN8764_c1_g10~~TRINITY_DN8764_c1_g10_i1.p1  ORF type:complete len:302 (-),score=54.06 TRINITY_DN8764_c1_g10_i1:493-1338(-)